MNTRYWMVLMLVLSLLLAACGSDDEEEDTNENNNTSPTSAPANNDTAATEAPATSGDNGGSVSTDDAGAALIAYVRGEFDTAKPYFCDEVQTQIDTAAAAAPAGSTTALQGVEYEATCSEDGGSISCELKSMMSGVETPLGSYTMTVADGKLCSLPTPVQ